MRTQAHTHALCPANTHVPCYMVTRANRKLTHARICIRIGVYNRVCIYIYSMCTYYIHICVYHVDISLPLCMYVCTRAFVHVRPECAHVRMYIRTCFYLHARACKKPTRACASTRMRAPTFGCAGVAPLQNCRGQSSVRIARVLRNVARSVRNVLRGFARALGASLCERY